MNRFERWILKGIIHKTVKQGNHYIKITALYKQIAEAARDEFTEDTKRAIDQLLEDCHKESLGV